jgi:RNA polymerase sigma-70 factor, ECF subfamily
MVGELESIRSFKSGNVDIFDIIYTNYYKSVYFYINKIVSDKTLAEDLVQETFIKVLRGLKDFDEDKKLAPWVFRIAHNTCIDHYRSSRMTFELIGNAICYDKENNSPENIILDKEKRDVIKEILLRMSQKYSTAILLRDFSNLTYKEIASKLKLNEMTVKTLIHRARKQFQKAYCEAY